MVMTDRVVRKININLSPAELDAIKTVIDLLGSMEAFIPADCECITSVFEHCDLHTDEISTVQEVLKSLYSDYEWEAELEIFSEE